VDEKMLERFTEYLRRLTDAIANMDRRLEVIADVLRKHNTTLQQHNTALQKINDNVQLLQEGAKDASQT
jgi:hypothetical protein